MIIVIMISDIMNVRVHEICSGCRNEINTRKEKYIVADGLFFHINHYKKNISPIKPTGSKPPKSNGHVPDGLKGVIKIGKRI